MRANNKPALVINNARNYAGRASRDKLSRRRKISGYDRASDKRKRITPPLPSPPRRIRISLVRGEIYLIGDTFVDP